MMVSFEIYNSLSLLKESEKNKFSLELQQVGVGPVLQAIRIYSIQWCANISPINIYWKISKQQPMTYSFGTT